MEIKDPWSMTYLEYADALIKRVKERLGRTHPLFSKEIFVAAVSNELDAALLEIKTEAGIEYAVLYYYGKYGNQGDGKEAKPEVVAMKDEQSVQHMIDEHHHEWLAKYSEQ